MKIVHTIASLLLILGGLVWGCVGVADYNPIMYIFVAQLKVQHLIYILIGLAAIWKIIFFKRCCCGCSSCCNKQ